MPEHDDFGGLQRDLGLLGAMMKRRDMIRLSAGLGMLHLLGCGGDNSGASEGCAERVRSARGPRGLPLAL